MSTARAHARVVSLLPVPPSVAALGAFAPVANERYGAAYLDAAAADAVGPTLAMLRQAFAQGATCGLSSVEAVRAVFFDMDATVIAEESLVELAAFAGQGEAVGRITERAMAGELDFKAALIERVALLQGLPADVLPVLAARLTLNPGIREFVSLCRRRGVPTFMVSGGFTVLAAAVQKQVGFDGIHANVLGIKDGKLTGKVDGDIVDAVAKQRYVLATCARLSLDPQAVAAVGDGANDLPMLTSVGVAVGFRPKPVLLPVIHAHNAVGDHAFLAPLLFGCGVGSASD